MAISNFIPGVWKENLFKQLDNNYIGVKHCTREYEGDIVGKGSIVNIPGLLPVNIFNYSKGCDMSTPQSCLSNEINQLKIDQAKAFHFAIDDIDRVQNNPKFMDELVRNAARALAKVAEKHVFSLFKGYDISATPDVANIQAYDVTSENVISYLYDAINVLYKNDITNMDDISIEVSPDIAMLIVKAKTELGVKDNDMLETGCIGRINGCKIFVSNNIYSFFNEDDQKAHRCFVRTNRAIAFAEQLSEMAAYRPERRFGDAVKGLYLYGAKLARPKEIVLIDFGVEGLSSYEEDEM